MIHWGINLPVFKLNDTLGQYTTIHQYITNVSCLTGELGKQMFEGVIAVEFYSSVIEFHEYKT